MLLSALRVCLETPCKWNQTVSARCDWLASQVHPHHIMYQNSLPSKAKWYSVLYVYTILLIHTSIDGHLDCSHFLDVVLLWTWVYKYIFESPLSIILGIYSEMELLDHMVILCLNFLGTVILLPIYIFQTLSLVNLLQIPSNTWLSIFIAQEF